MIRKQSRMFMLCLEFINLETRDTKYALNNNRVFTLIIL
jgi:hypothetical protein